LGKLNSDFPNLRFKGFEGAWEVKKMGEIADIKTGNKDTQNKVDNGMYPFFVRSNTVEKINTYSYDGEAILTSGDGVGVGKNFHYVKGKFDFHQRVYSIRNFKKGYDGKYVYNIFSEKFYDRVIRLSAKNSVDSVRMNMISEMKISFPMFNEQLKIASFLTMIRDRIQTQKKIIEDLVILKSNTAQNIFNQVFKFKDSEGNDFRNWQIKKLGDVCEIKRGASPRPISDSKWFDDDSKIGWVRISDVTKSDKYLEKTEQYLSNAGISKSRLVKKGNMIMSICATIGKPIYTNFDVCIHDGFVVFENLTLDKEFLYYYLDFIQLNWYKYGQPGIQVNLNSEIVNNESVVVPVIEEQIKIAEFLSKFDEKIKLENELLTQYENQKKYLLQNLFV